MNLTLPLDRMSIAEKLRAMEEIWDDLSRSAEDVPSPPWHEDVLRARAERIRDGSSKFMDWEQAKQSIRDAIK